MFRTDDKMVVVVKRKKSGIERSTGRLG